MLWLMNKSIDFDFALENSRMEKSEWEVLRNIIEKHNYAHSF